MPPLNAPEDSYSDEFTAEAVASISEDLFGKPSAESTDALKDSTEEASLPKEAAPVEEKPTQAPVAQEGQIQPGQNSVGKPLPKSWRKDVAPLWEKADPALHEYIYSREADMMRGIQQYAAGYQQWDALMRPYASIFQQHRDIQPVDIFQGLMKTHLQLLNPDLPGEKKLEMAKAIMSEYGIDFGEAQPQARPEYVAQLERRLAQIENQNRTQAERAFAEGVAQQEKLIQAFAQDPKNKYFPEVQADILRFIQAGVANDLPSAYELACYANPAVRAKLLAEQQVTPNAPGTPQKRDASGKFVNLDSVEDPKPARTRRGTIDDTINQVVSSHFPKH